MANEIVEKTDQLFKCSKIYRTLFYFCLSVDLFVFVCFLQKLTVLVVEFVLSQHFLSFPVTSPQVFISPTRLSVREGESAQFRCSASGFPAPVLQWHGGSGGVLPPEAVLSNGNGLLTFVEVKEIHEGAYVCTASNLGGITSTGTFLNVSGKISKSFCFILSNYI